MDDLLNRETQQQNIADFSSALRQNRNNKPDTKVNVKSGVVIEAEAVARHGDLVSKELTSANAIASQLAESVFKANAKLDMNTFINLDVVTGIDRPTLIKVWNKSVHTLDRDKPDVTSTFEDDLGHFNDKFNSSMTKDAFDFELSSSLNKGVLVPIYDAKRLMNNLEKAPAAGD